MLGIAQRRQDIANQYKWDEEEEALADGEASDLDGFLDDDDVSFRRVILRACTLARRKGM